MAMFVTGTGSPFPTGSNPVSNATADLDGDGDLDLLITNYISDNVSVLLNNGSGVFVAGTPVAVTNGPREVEVGDIDGDGDIDFLASNYAGNNVTIGRNNGNGTFTTSSVAVGSVPRGLALGDLDGDGDLDFVAANYNGNTVSVLLNDGSGSFTNIPGSPVPVGTRPVAVAIADLDGDGDQDIAVTSNNTNKVTILLNAGIGGFVAATPATTGAGPRGIAAGDFDGDGDADLVVTNFSANSLSVLLNDGHAAFAALPTTLPTQNNPYAVTVGDLDGDGDLDIAATNSGSSSVSVFINNGSGVFAAADGSPYGVTVSPGGVVMGDFDHDGDLDLSTANFGSNNASILRNTTSHRPSAVALTNVSAPLPENTSTSAAIKVADIVVTDDDGGINTLTLAGDDAALFEISGTELRLRAGIDLDFATNPVLNVQVNVDGAGTGMPVDASTTLALDLIEVMTGTGGDDRLSAAGGNSEIILGKRGDDLIKAKRGDDTIQGGKGADTMTGGADADSFVFKSIGDSAPNQSGLVDGRFAASAGAGLRDVITDFQHGIDHLDFSAIDADTDLAGNQSFRWGNARSFTDVPGKLIARRFDEAGTAHDRTIIYGDNDGDGKADFQVELKGLLHLTAADFVL